MRAEMREAMPWPTSCCSRLSPTAIPPVIAIWAPIERASLMRPEQARPAAVDFGDAPHEPHDLGDDEHDVEDRARADRGHQRHALGGGGDLAFRLVVERPQQRALGDVDEVAPVDDGARRILDFRARARRLGPVAVERDQSADEPARRGAIVGRARLGEGDMHFRDPRLPPDGNDLARRDANKADQNTRPNTTPIIPSDSALANSPSMRLVAHRPKASETRPPSPVQARPARVTRERAMSPDFCAASTSSSASSIGAGAAAGIGSFCERMIASGASDAG